MIPHVAYSTHNTVHALDAFCSSGPSPTALLTDPSPRLTRVNLSTQNQTRVHLFVTPHQRPQQLSQLVHKNLTIVGITQTFETLRWPVGLDLGQAVQLLQSRIAWLSAPQLERLSLYEAVERVDSTLIVDARRVRTSSTWQDDLVQQASHDFEIPYMTLDMACEGDPKRRDGRPRDFFVGQSLCGFDALHQPTAPGSLVHHRLGASTSRADFGGARGGIR
ncbi:MAG: hypothetical protein VX589_17010 [Myxococcota bacterium]|nr:hypothetical protein [Myxococcota bacterium]